MYERDWGGNVRARIELRKLEGREAIEGEEGRLGVPDPEEVTPAEIRQAFDTGEEVSGLYQSMHDIVELDAASSGSIRGP